jgi:hypothetical protein
MSGGRGVRAALPAGDHRRPAVLDDDGVVVVHVSEKGDQRALYDFSRLPGPAELQQSLAALFARQAGPAGPWRSIVSSREAWSLLGSFARWLSTLEVPPGDIDRISPAIWNQWRVSRASNALGERQVRKIGALLRLDSRLPADTREATLKRVARSAAAESSYPPEQFEEIKQAVTASFRAAWQRISGNRRHLEAWRDGQFGEGTQDWLLGHALDHLARTGDVPTYIRESDGTRQIRGPVMTALGGIRSEFTWQRLYLNGAEVVSLAALMVISYGWNSTPVAELAVPEVLPGSAPGEPVTYRVELEKRRRHRPHRYETRNLTDWGPNAPGRLITRAIEATSPGRDLLAAHGAPTTRLLAWHAATPLLVADRTELFRLGFADAEIRQWKVATGAPELSLRRLRRTVAVLHRREPTQHSQDIHDSVYVLRDPAAREQAAPVIADGIAEAIAHAQAVVKARISRDDRDSQADTATASCGDNAHSPFSPHGSPCRASFLLCLACPNAVITPRHLPRLAYLHQALDALRAVLPAKIWDHDWREHHARLAHLKSSVFTPAEWTDALHAASSADRAIIDALLRRGFDS